MADLIRNAPVQEALDVWATTKDNRTFSDVLRRALVGELLLDISTSTIADPSAGPRAGDTIALASQTDNAGKHLLLAYTDNERLAARSPQSPLSLGQPAAAVLEQAMRDYEGLVIDAGHPGMFIAYAAEIRQGLGDDPEAAATLARDVVLRERAFDEFLGALALAPVYIAVDAERDETGEVRSLSVRLATGPNGERFSALFTAPCELWAWAPDAQARPTRLANVARVAREDGHAGAVVNPAGPAVTIPVAALGFYVDGPAEG